MLIVGFFTCLSSGRLTTCSKELEADVPRIAALNGKGGVQVSKMRSSTLQICGTQKIPVFRENGIRVPERKLL